MDDFNDYFDREGNPTELTYNRFLENDPELSPKIIELLETNPDYQARVAELRTVDAAFSIKPPAALKVPVAQPTATSTPSNVVSLDSRRRTPWAAVGAVAAILLAGISALFIFGDTDPDQDIVRIKGKQFSIQAFLETQTGPREVNDGETIKPADRIGFKVKNTKEGFLLILGRDETGTFYPVYPQRGSTSAKFIQAASDGRDLKAAVQFDGVGSQESIIATFCGQSFSANDVRTRLEKSANKKPDAQPLAACEVQTFNFKKSQ